MQFPCLFLFIIWISFEDRLKENRIGRANATDEQFLELFNEVEPDEELLSNSSDEDEGSLDLVEALNTASEDAETI